MALVVGNRMHHCITRRGMITLRNSDKPIKKKILSIMRVFLRSYLASIYNFILK